MCRNPFAMKNGKMIFIDDLSESERGLNCGCLCPVCNDKFIARMGETNVHHFAHSNEGCSEILTYTTGLYLMLKQMFDEGCTFYIPALVAGYDICTYTTVTPDTVEQYVKIIPETTEGKTKILVAEGKYIKFDSAELSYDKKNHIQALEMTYNNKTVAIKVTPPVTVCKTGAVSKHKDLPTLEMDFRKDSKTIQTSNSVSFREYVSKSKNLSRWIYNEKIKKAYPEIIEKINMVFEEYQKRRKEQEPLYQQELEQRQKWNEEREFIIKQKLEERERQNYIASIPREKLERQGYEQVKDLFIQQDTPIFDKFNTRWVQCEICGELKMGSEFSSYGGAKHVNLGTCSECSRKRREINI
jgi:hypothetical protein